LRIALHKDGDKWTDIEAFIGEGNANRHFQHVQAVTDRVPAAHFHATITAVWHSLGDTFCIRSKGSEKQITFNKATTLYGVLLKRRKGSQADHIGIVLCPTWANQAKNSGRDPFRARKL
jgi:hypothetical protein